MDKEPLIIKSGAGHKVEIEQGSTHAKGRRNVVVPGDEARSDQVVKDGPSEERKSIDLSVEAEDVGVSTAAVGAVLVEPPADAPAASSVDAEAVATAARAASPVLDPAEPAAAAEGPAVLREVLADRDATADKAEVLADRFLGWQDGGPPSEELVSEPEPQPLTNRQKIEQLQASANKILVNQAERTLGELEVERHIDPEPDLGLAADDDTPLAAPAAPEDVPAPSLVPVAASEELPPELAGNLGFAPPAKESADSAFLARVRALRNNMSVTDNRLTALQDKAPVKP